MKLSELISEAKKALDKSGDVEVGIAVANPSMGSHPVANIKKFRTGFDWDQGKVFIDTDYDLLALPGPANGGHRKFEEAEVVTMNQVPNEPTTLVLKHKGGFVGDNLKVKLEKDSLIRIIKLR